jgi:hypothetical protein
MVPTSTGADLQSPEALRQRFEHSRDPNDIDTAVNLLRSVVASAEDVLAASAPAALGARVVHLGTPDND